MATHGGIVPIAYVHVDALEKLGGEDNLFTVMNIWDCGDIP